MYCVSCARRPDDGNLKPKHVASQVLCFTVHVQRINKIVGLIQHHLNSSVYSRL